MSIFFTDSTTVEKLRAVCLDQAKLGENNLGPSLDSLFFGPSASRVLYLTEVGFFLFKIRVFHHVVMSSFVILGMVMNFLATVREIEITNYLRHI